jgi:hypothetical protein
VCTLFSRLCCPRPKQEAKSNEGSFNSSWKSTRDLVPRQPRKEPLVCSISVDRSEDADASSAGSMNSLLAQLLTRYEDFDLSTVHNLKNVNTESTKELCKVFAKLVSQLPEEILIFCVIDGLSYYDDEERREDAEKLLVRLTALTRENKRGEELQVQVVIDGEESAVFQVLG